jgi:GxxExxY protein
VLNAVSTYPEKELTESIIGAAFEVHNVLGPGFLEKVYRNALLKELLVRGHGAEAEVKIPVYYKGESVGDYYADVLVDERVILELKALAGLTGEHKAQLLNYLKATGLKIGLLLNFGTRKVQIKRKIL